MEASIESAVKVIGQTYYTHLRYFLNKFKEKVGLEGPLFLVHWDSSYGPVVATTEKNKVFSSNIKSIKKPENNEYVLIKKIIGDPEKFDRAVSTVLDMESMMPEEYNLSLIKDNKTILFHKFESENHGSRGGKELFLLIYITEKPSPKRISKIKKAAKLLNEEFLEKYFKIFKKEGNNTYVINEEFIEEFLN
ncbi:hypothetical protein GF352_01930, partial|nr:hypothetical protein [archaeon]